MRSPAVIRTMLTRLFPDGVPARRSEATNSRAAMTHVVDRNASLHGSPDPV